MTDLTPELLAELESKARAAAALQKPWAPYTGHIEEGGQSCFIREHQVSFEEEVGDREPDEVEEERAEIDEAFCKALSPQVTLELLAVAREHLRLKTAVEALDRHEGTPSGGKSFREGTVLEIFRRATRFGWVDPFTTGDKS